MAARAAQLFWRDMRLVGMLLAWAAFGTAAVLYFSVTAQRAGPAPAGPTLSDAALFTGSIVVVPRSGHDCWKMMLDNRTGRMWEDGYLACDLALGVPAEKRADEGKRAGRLQAIGASFRDNR